MFIYNVTLKIDWSIMEDWLKWMKDEHMPEVLSTGCFENSRLLRLIEVDETDGPTFAAQYTAKTREAYNRYITQYAEILRKKSFEKWGNRFIAFRSVMELVH
ncbi:DUF4286 family protein [Flavihumibacter profundi]|uniref:DUF4286 family protein n=1 Tax=Flavihumibacter profundi TaxID=2716883 RepID=UPI001CC604BF|nr:DUF4286 family protein [Flavihumibacter profundi]MBZ5858725.1 DUF4286 family protein [Flavihumibacter profundi]